MAGKYVDHTLLATTPAEKKRFIERTKALFEIEFTDREVLQYFGQSIDSSNSALRKSFGT